MRNYDFLRNNSKEMSSMSDVHSVGERIRVVRLLLKETQEEFAEHCDISPEAVSSIERGVYLPRLETLQKFSDYTKVSLASLFTNYMYVVERDTKTNEDGEEYTCYGIKAYENNQIVNSLLDVFLNEPIAKDFADMCNRLQLNPIHLENAIEDYL